MCVIEEKTYRQSDGTIKTVPVLSPCHRYIAVEKCDFTEYRGGNNESPRFVEIRPSTSASASTAAGRPGSSSSLSERTERILVDSKGRHRRYVTVVRRSANQTSSSARANAGGSSPAPPSPRGILKQTHSRNVSDSEASGISSMGYSTRMVEPDSAGSSARPSSMGSYTELFDQPQSRRGSPRYESATGNIDDDGFLQPPRRTTSVRVVQQTTKTTSEKHETRRPSPIDTGVGSSRARASGHTRSDSASDLPLRQSTKGKERESEVRFVTVDEIEHEEDRQSRLERERLANTDRRQQGRERRLAAESDVAALQARMERDARERVLNAEAHQRQTSEEAQAAAERARQRAERNAKQSERGQREHQEQREEARRQKASRDRADYDLEQMRREKEEYEHRMRGDYYGDSPLGSPTLSYATTSPTPSASRPALLPVPPAAYRSSSPVGSYASPTFSARTPSGTTVVQTVVHNPRREGRANTYDRGARVLEEEQQRAALREMDADMAAMRFDGPLGPAEPNQGRRRDDRGRQQYYQ